MSTSFTNEQLRRIRRGFIDRADGQTHYRCCGPALQTGSDQPPLVMLHGSPGSSFSLVPTMLHLGENRPVIAPDHPGNGDSTPLATSDPTIPDFAAAHIEALDGIGLEQFDLYGYHTGASIAIQIAARWPQRVRRLILDGPSLFSAEERERLFAQDHAPAIALSMDGSHLTTAFAMVRDAHLFWPWWNRSVDGIRQRGLPSPDFLHGEVLEVLKALASYHLTYRSALSFDKKSLLADLSQPVLVTAGPRDQNIRALHPIAALIPGALAVEIPGLDTEADISASAARFEMFLAA